MLEFSLNNQPFAIVQGKSVRLSWHNPACNFTEFPGDIGMGIEIPVNDINRALLGNPERFERYAGENNREFNRFEIRYGGVLLMGGTLIIKTANNENYTGWLRSDIGNIGKQHREKYIFDSISFLEEKIFDNKADYDPLTDDYACPRVYNIEFFKEKGEKTEIERKILNPDYEVLNWWQNIWHKQEDPFITEKLEVEDLTWAFLKTAGWFVNYKNEDGTIKAPVTATLPDADNILKNLEVCAVSPMLFLNYILKAVFKDSEFYLDKNFIADDPDLKKLILYNNFDITRITYIVAKIVWEYQDWYDKEFSHAIGNPVDNIQRDVLGPFLYKDLVPQIRLKDFLLSIQNLLNVCFFFRTGRRIVDIIDRESILINEAIDVEKYLTGFWEMGDKKDVTLKFTFKHDDGDLMFTERWENIDDLRDKEKEPVATWEDLENIENPEMDEIRFIKNQNIYVQYKVWLRETNDDKTGDQVQEKYLGWSHITDAFQNGFYNYGKEEEEEIPTHFGTLTGEDFPRSYQKGNIRSEMFAYENFTPRLMFYLGNNEARYHTDNIAIDWEKEGLGLLETRWKNWARFWATRQPVSCEAHFPLNMLSYVLSNLTSKFRTREGEFIIEEMETEFGINQIGVTKINGYKLSYAPNVYQLTDIWRIGENIWTDQDITFELINIFL